MRQARQEKMKEMAWETVFSHAYGFIKAAGTDELKEELALALIEALSVAESALEAIPDAEAAGDAGIYEFDLHRAVAEADK